jgi:hypothetical protein
MEPFVCFLNLFFVSNFSIFASQHNEPTLRVDLGFSPSPGLKGKIFSIYLHRKLMRAQETLSTGMKRAPDWDSFYLQKFSAKTTFP